MTAGDPTSLVPFDFLGADHVVIPGYKPMRMKSSSFIKEAFVGSPLSMPEYFAMEDNFTILWGPVPDDDYVVEIGYFCRPESIVTLPQTTQAGVSAPDPLNRETYTSINFPTLLLHGALAFGYGFQRDFEARNSSMDAFTKTLTLANGYVKGKFSVQDFEKASAAIVTE